METWTRGDIIYVIYFLGICLMFVVTAICAVISTGVFTNEDIGESLILSALWPVVILLSFFRFISFSGDSSPIVLYRRRKNKKS